MTPALTFHGDPAVKQFYLNRALAHQAGSKGCAVTCLIHGSSHRELADAIGIPVPMAHLIDILYEGMPNSEARAFPVRFIQALPVGVDVQPALDRYVHCLLSDPTYGTIAFANPATKRPIQAVVDLYARRLAADEPSAMEWRAAALGARDFWEMWAAGWPTPETAAGWAEAAARAAAWVCAAARAAAEAGAAETEKSWAAAVAANMWAATRAAAVAAMAVMPTTEHYSWQASVLITFLESSTTEPKANEVLA